MVVRGDHVMTELRMVFAGLLRVSRMWQCLCRKEICYIKYVLLGR